MCVPLALQGGCESERQSAGCTGSSPGSHPVHKRLEKNAARHQYERGQEHFTEVGDTHKSQTQWQFNLWSFSGPDCFSVGFTVAWIY